MFFLQKMFEEECVMHSKSYSIKSAPFNNVNDVDYKLFEPLHSIFQNNLEILIRGSDFILNSVQLLYYKYINVGFRYGRSYIDLQTG